jgi:hypothetical protein
LRGPAALLVGCASDVVQGGPAALLVGCASDVVQGGPAALLVGCNEEKFFAPQKAGVPTLRKPKKTNAILTKLLPNRLILHHFFSCPPKVLSNKKLGK